MVSSTSSHTVADAVPELERLEEMTLTEAHAKSGLVLVTRCTNLAHLSNGRNIPYAEFYRDRSGVIDTPAENLQKAAVDEAKRKRSVR